MDYTGQSQINEGFNWKISYGLYMGDFRLPCVITGGYICRLIMEVAGKPAKFEMVRGG
jgi:hypothetical protein